MTRIDIVSGFLGAGKTTLIKKLLKEALAHTKVVLIENEFGEIGIDGGFLKESGIEIREMNAGCICCSLVGDFGASLEEVMNKYAPERILIEPSGVGKLSDVMNAVQNVADNNPEMELSSAVTVIDCTKAKLYIKNFGEFFTNQIANAGTIILTRTDRADEQTVQETVDLVREYNKKATVITTPLEQLDGKDILNTFEGNRDLAAQLMKQVLEEHHHEEECHHHEEGECHHHHEEESCHHHHGDEEDHREEGHEHHHHGEAPALVADEEGVVVHRSEDAHLRDGHHHHHHHGAGEHDADEVFQSWGMETPKRYGKENIKQMLDQLNAQDRYGFVLRAKGILPSEDGGWMEFDYVPGEQEIRPTSRADVTGKIVVIGSGLKEDALEGLFRENQQ
ncbi:MAG: GTP-binding protein [Lachnospiraceae bacterium]|nr:GTP-binding protein [Lachnospiraceae bacterium]